MFPFEALRIPFRLCHIPKADRNTYVVVTRLVQEKCVVYLDDILVFVKSLEENSGYLDEVSEWLIQFSLQLKPSKCQNIKSYTLKECSETPLELPVMLVLW